MVFMSLLFVFLAWYCNVLLLVCCDVKFLLEEVVYDTHRIFCRYTSKHLGVYSSPDVQLY